MESQDGFVQETADNVLELERLMQRLDEFIIQIDQIELKLNEVTHFYSSENRKHPNTSEAGSMVGNEYRDKLVESSKKRKSIAAHMEIANAKRMQELVHEFGTIIHEITQQKCAEPFIRPVDVIGLGLNDYYEVVEKPMDFSTIKRKMKAKVDTGYKNVREICADVRLIFDNAMKYYKETDDLYVMAKTLLDMFETRWLEFLPKVDEEEKRQKEDGQMQQGIYLTEEAEAKMVRDLAIEVDELEMQLNEISDAVYQKYNRKMASKDIINLREAIGQLSYEGINKVIKFIAANDSNFEQTAGETVEIDLDAQSNYTLWRLKFLVENELQAQTIPPCSGEDDDEGNNLNNSDTIEQETGDGFRKD